MHRERLRSARAVAAAVGVASVGLVVAATASVPGPTGTARFLPQDTLREGIGSVVRLAWIVFLFVLLYEVMTGFGGRLKAIRHGGGHSRPWWAWLAAIVVVAGAAVLVVPRLRLPDGGEESDPLRGDGVTMPVPFEVPAGEPATALVPGPGWQLWTMAVVGVVALCFLLYRARRRPVSPTRASTVPVAATAASDVTTSFPDGPRPTDPRGRVVAAYRRVEWVAGPAGMPRSSGETIRGHLGRVGARTDVDSARALAATYETARYSPFEPTETDVRVAEEAEATLTEQLG